MKRTTCFCLLLAGLTLALSACQNSSPETRVIAHRGYWATEGSAQNSLAALRLADSIHAYGSECDVFLCADGVLMVEHDPKIQLNGTEAYMERTPSMLLRSRILTNGEPMPSFAEYLNLFKECRHTRLVIELKSSELTPEQQTELAEKAIAMVRAEKLEGRVEYIAFSLYLCEELIRLDPQAAVSYLNGDLTPDELQTKGFAGLDYHLAVLREHPEWIDRAHQLGLTVNTWTLNTEEDMCWAIDRGVDFITTDEPLLLQQLLSKSTSR